VTDRSYDGIWPLAAFPESTDPYWFPVAYTIEQINSITHNSLKEHRKQIQRSHLTCQKSYYCFQWVKSWILYNKHKNTQDFTFLVGSGISKALGWVSSDSFCSKSVASVANQWRNTKNLRQNQSIQQRQNLKLITQTTRFQKTSNPQYPTTQTSQFQPQSQHRKKNSRRFYQKNQPHKNPNTQPSQINKQNTKP